MRDIDILLCELNANENNLRISIIAHLGQVKNQSTIDIGVGDGVRASFYLSKSLKIS